MLTLLYRNFRLLVLVIILILFVGLSSFFSLPRLEDPQLTSRNAIVKTFFPGANAERVEALVTEKIEKKLSEIEEIKTYESISRIGSSIIQIELIENVTDENTSSIWSRIRDQIDDVSVDLPLAATEPKLEEFDTKAYALIAGLTWQQNDQVNYAILRRSIELLKDELESLPGTGKVKIFGAPDEEITVVFDAQKLAALNITAQELSRQIQESDAKISAGQFRSSTDNLSLEVDSELKSIESIKNIPLKFGPNSQLVRIGDIARVSKGVVEPLNELTLISGHPAISLAVFVESNYQIDTWTKAAQNAIDSFKQQLPKGLELREIFSQHHYVKSRLNSLIANLLLGALLVFVATLFMMGWRSAFIVSTTLPLSICMVFGLMRIFKIPLHQMSISGIIIALGLLIDTAIVIVDEVNYHLQIGTQPKAAIVKSVRHLIAPLLGSTLTTILAFMPLILLPGAAGEFVGPIGISVVLAVSSSLFLSILIIPALVIHLHRNKSRAISSQFGSHSIQFLSRNFRTANSTWWDNGFSHPYLTKIYKSSQKKIFSQPVWGILLALFLPTFGLIQTFGLAEEFFPPADRDQIQIELELSASTSLAQTYIIAQQARNLILEHSEVVDVDWFIGRSAPRYYYNLVGGREQYANYAQGVVQLNSIAKSNLINELQLEIDEAFPTARIILRQLGQGPPFDAPIELRIYGSNLEKLQRLGEEARSTLAQIPQITHTRDSLSEVLPQLKLKINEDKAQLAGLSNTSISEQLETTLEGKLGGTILETTEELPVRIRISNQERGDLALITSLDLIPITPNINKQNSDSINSITLSSVGKMEVKPEIHTISRRNGRRYNLVQGYIAAGVLPSKVLKQFQQGMKETKFNLPFGYWTEIGGESEERDQTLAAMFKNIEVLAAFMVAILILSLNSFQLSLIIGIVAICSIFIGFLSLSIFGYPLSFMGIIGTFGLVGISVNDAMVVLAALRNNPAAQKGNSQAVREVMMRETPHILTTTLTTIIGFVPLVIGEDRFWPPLAVALAGGISGATLLALYFVPSAYLLIVTKKSYLKTQKKFV